MLYLTDEQKARAAVVLSKLGGDTSQAMATVVAMLNEHADLRSRNNEITEALIDLLDDLARRAISDADRRH